MKKKNLFGFIIFSGCVVVLISAAAQPFSGGAPPGMTGAPPDPLTCRFCHDDFTLNSGNGSVSIDSPSDYEPDQVLDLTVTVEDPDALLYGFEITAKDDGTNLVGTWEIVDADSKFAAGSSDYVTHNSALAGAQEKTWTLRWIAPPISVGNVHFYAAGNGANGDGGRRGDRIYTTTRTIMPANITGTESEQVLPTFRVTDVFPNPFVGDATFTFDVSRQADVSMMIYDLNGRLLLTKSLGTVAAGSHQTYLRAGNLPAGVLFYRFITDAVESTGRIVLLR